MTSSSEKRAIIAKLEGELQDEADDQLVEELLENVSRGPRNMWDTQEKRIVASAVHQKYGYGVISDAVLKKLANRLGVDKVSQFHVDDPDADYCGDGSYTYLKLGLTKDAKIQQVRKEMSRLEGELNELSK